MRAKSSSAKKPAEQVVMDIRRVTRRHFSAEDKIRIVLDGLRGEDSIAELYFTRLGAPSSSSTISSGFLASNATAARVFIQSTPWMEGIGRA
jgi:hypothetical protein